MKVIKQLINILLNISVFLLIFLMVLNFMSNPSSSGLFGLKGYSVLSNSMQPTFSAGDYLIDYQTAYEDLKEGDVITYLLDNGIIVTHRITAETSDGFVTQGDANEFADDMPVTKEAYIAQYRFHIPYLGQLLIGLSQPIAFITLIFILAIYLLGIYLSNRHLEEN
ncbi:signal peptidase I [Fundicoccus culcitae]|uniref:Signal peptidase I n=1 Tax=Fundicoccus culcitae TaxID=2969821 RepID=A0ABY5P8I9_9LACT|nr:signal peptidase I [Fundicoccus culcitae]UUX35062.1 signal peptidase I [Fundicoccus culcitae]